MSSHEYFDKLGVLVALEHPPARHLEENKAQIRSYDSCRAAHEERARILR